MSEALYRIEKVERPPGPVAVHAAAAMLSHVWPLAGLLLFDWDVLEAGFAYWGGLGAFLGYALVRILPVSRQVAGFFLLHGGVFWLGCLQLVSALREPGTSVWALGWGRMLGVAALAGAMVVAQEWRYGRLEAAAGRRVEGLGLVGRYYWRMLLLAILLVGVGAGPDAQRAGWILLMVSAGLDAGFAAIGTLWPRRFVRNAPAATAP